MVKFVPKDDRCNFCNNESSLLCDMPSMTIVTSIDFKTKVCTCDKKLCTSCTTRVNGFDFCPDCVKKIKLAKKGVNDE